jgi:hypothetical protein
MQVRSHARWRRWPCFTHGTLPEHDVGKNSYNIMRVRRAFSFAFQQLLAPLSVRAPCCAPAPLVAEHVPQKEEEERPTLLARLVTVPHQLWRHRSGTVPKGVAFGTTPTQTPGKRPAPPSRRQSEKRPRRESGPASPRSPSPQPFVLGLDSLK